MSPHCKDVTKSFCTVPFNKALETLYLCNLATGRPISAKRGKAHTGTFRQNLFHYSTSLPTPGMAGILKEAKMYVKFEAVQSTRFEQSWKNSEK